MPASVVHEPVISWYAESARSLPWRQPGVDGWHVLVSEVMLQQTPVSRVLAVYSSWVARWPSPSALASDSAGQAVRMWGALGYPRRALRLHAAAVVIDKLHHGEVPKTYDELRTLPGVGDYTAAAVAAFAFQQRTVVLDTNVRRVLSRVFTGVALPRVGIVADERRLAEQVLPDDAPTAVTWSVAAMELGAVVCTARAPRCEVCPVSGLCAWRRLGYPTDSSRTARRQSYVGTDRQCRGRLLALLRSSDVPLPWQLVDAAWSDGPQRQRA
nr:A/G-specific adenine glycosylase [Propionibacteriales bacterium]